MISELRASEGWAFACPTCRGALGPAPAALECVPCGRRYDCVDGIWRFVSDERAAAQREFLAFYETVRVAEGREAARPDELRELPYVPRDHPQAYEWGIRVASFRALLSQVVAPLERQTASRLRIADLGCGNGWLAHRLAERGHQLAACDIHLSSGDGLAAHRHYEHRFVSLQADFGQLPFPDGTLDLAIYNGSFHYAEDYAATLTEGLRVLRSSGLLLILDSPVYSDERTGDAMVREREQRFRERFGPTPVRSSRFLSDEGLTQLGRALRLRWSYVRPYYGWRWFLLPAKARLLGRRAPARFKLILGRRQA